MTKMSSVVGCLETDEVGGEDAAEEGFAYSEAAEDLGRGESDVEEKADGDDIRGGKGGAEKEWEKHEMVVVYPYCVRNELNGGREERKMTY